MRLLLVEDSDRLRRSLERGLRLEGFAVDAAPDGEEGLWLAREHPYDAVVLDLALPKLSGLELLRALRRSARARTPVLILSAKDMVEDRVAGLDAGADDYLVKPFAFEELCARLRALVRRGYDSPAPLLVGGGLVVDTVARSARVDGREVALTPRELAVLELLAHRAGNPVGRREIEDHLFPLDGEPESNVVAVHVASLRRKLAAAGAAARVVTRRGFGYVLESEERPS